MLCALIKYYAAAVGKKKRLISDKGLGFRAVRVRVKGFGARGINNGAPHHPQQANMRRVSPAFL